MSVQTVCLTDSALLGIDPYPSNALMAKAEVDQVQKVFLGRIRPQTPAYVPRMSVYYDPSRATITLPASTNYRAKAKDVIARMYLNDREGDCVIAGKWHAIGIWTANDSGIGVQATDAEVQRDYTTICGPGDNGCVITRVLDVMRTKGLVTGGKAHTIDGYVSVDWTNQQLVKAVQYIGGASTIGINLPQAWTSSAIWDVTNTPIVGGHDVTPVDYDATGVYVVSWGRIYLITWPAFMSTRWIEEYYFLLSPDWYGNDKLAPCGIDAVTLKADMAKLGQGQMPDDPTPPVPPVPPIPPSPPVPVPGKASLVVSSTLAPGTYSIT